MIPSEQENTLHESGRTPQSAPPIEPHLARLESRLLETLSELWDDFVDPAEPYYDQDGTRWNPLAGGPGSAGAAGVAFANEQQLREIRDQCRALAVSNEFAINGHEEHPTKAQFRRVVGLHPGRSGFACRAAPTTRRPLPPRP